MSAHHALPAILCVLLGACAAPQTSGPLSPGPAMDRATIHTATMDAEAACGGPFIVWSRTTKTSEWPYRIQITETMRCLKDGRVVGPFTYRGDDL